MGDYDDLLAQAGQISAPSALSDSASYKAFLAALGVTEAQALANSQSEAIARDYASAQPRIIQQGAEAERGVASSFLSRGSYDSGERIRQQGLVTAGTAQRQADLATQATDANAQIQATLAGKQRDAALAGY